jgi:uncharacterized repeat protein (TIGR01451 family)
LFARAPRAAAFAVLAIFVALLSWPGAADAFGTPSIADREAGITSSATPLDGQPLVYTLTAANKGPGDDSNVKLVQTLPTNATFYSAPGCSHDSDAGTVTCTKDSLPNGETATFTVTVTPTQAGAISSQVIVSGDAIDENSMNDSATNDTTVAPAADLSLSLARTPDHPSVNDVVTYFAGVTNQGPDAATNVKVTDMLPAGVEFQPSPGCSETDGTVTCTKAGSLASSATTFFEIKAKLTSTGRIVNSATVSSDTADPVTANDTDGDTIQAEADLSLSDAFSSASPPARVGQPFEFVLTVTNHGPDAAANVKATDKLPAGVAFESGTGCTATSQVVTCTASSLAKDASKEFRLQVHAARSGTYTDDAAVTSDATDAVPGNNSDSADAPVESVVNLAVSLSRTPADPVAGGQLSYTVTVKNNGDDDAEGLSVTDVLPSGTSFVSADPSCALSAGTVTCSQDTLAASGTATFHLTVRADQAGSVQNTVSATTRSTDSDGTDNSATNTAIVAPAPVAAASADLGIRVSRDAPRLVRGVEAIYTLGAVNHGPSAASGVKITATLPGTVTYLSASSGCTHSGATVTCSVGPLASGARASRAIRVRPNRTGTTSTRATITSSANDPDTSDNTDADTAYVEEPSASRGRLIVCRVGHNGSICTVRYDGKGRPNVTGSLRRGTHTYASGSTRSGRPLRLKSRHRIGEGKYTLVRSYNGRQITFDAVYVVVVR